MAGPARLRRDAGVIGLLYASLGSIIGSGWLFGALHAAVQAGPWSVLSWVIGAVVILFLFVILMAYSFHPSNMVLQASSTPKSGMFTAVATAGIIFSLFGFQQAIALAGETRNPNRYVPIALISSVIIGMLIYVGLQIAFITTLDPRDIANGWEHLHFTGMFGPLAAIAVTVGAL